MSEMIGERNGEASRGEKRRKEKLREEVGGANVRG